MWLAGKVPGDQRKGNITGRMGELENCKVVSINTSPGGITEQILLEGMLLQGMLRHMRDECVIHPEGTQ